MSDRQRRTICRASFLLFAFLPTVLVLGRVVWPISPADWEKQSAAFLDLDVVIEGVTPTDTGQLFMNVTIADPQLGRLASIDKIERHTNGTRQTLFVDQLTLPRRHAMLLAADLADRCFARQKVDVPETSLLVHQLLITEVKEGRSSPWRSYDDLRIHFLPSETELKLQLEIRPAGGASDDAVEIELVWPRLTDQQAQTTFETGSLPVEFRVSTGSHAVDCQLLAPWLPIVKHWGEAAQFHGIATGVWRSNSDWALSLQGNFTNIDLNELVSKPLGHSLFGLADVVFHTLKFESGRIVDVAGHLKCDVGQIEQKLIEDGEFLFNWQQLAHPISWPAQFRDCQIAFATDVHTTMLRLENGRPDRVIAENATGEPWLVHSEQTDVSILALVRWLVPQSPVSVPASRESTTLLNLLPLPPQAPRMPSDSGAGHLQLEE